MVPDLSIVIVNTNERAFLARCLESVYRETSARETSGEEKPPVSLEVIVVDNASGDGSREMLASDYPLARVIVNPENLGFAASNNRAIPEARGRYILMLNPDTEILDGALQKTVRFMDEHPGAGICGCRLRFPDRTIQRSVRSFPTVWNIFCETTFLYLVPWFPPTTRYTLSDFRYDTEREVDWVCGAYMMIRREVVDRIGILDEQFYMYTEEVDYCYRAKKAGFEVWFTPRAEIVHFWGGVSRPTMRVMVWGHGSQMLFFQKHFTGAERRTLIALKYAGILFRIGVYFLAGCLSLNKRLLAKAYYSSVAAYRLVARPWRYRPDFTGKVVPWSRL